MILSMKTEICCFAFNTRIILCRIFFTFIYFYQFFIRMCQNWCTYFRLYFIFLLSYGHPWNLIIISEVYFSLHYYFCIIRVYCFSHLPVVLWCIRSCKQGHNNGLSKGARATTQLWWAPPARNNVLI